jgi:gas vesicle protein
MNKKTFVEGIAIGAVTGTIATILLAAKSGKDTRKEIKSHLAEIKDKLVEELVAAGDFPQKKYDEAVKAVVGEYKAAKKLTGKEAKDLQARLAGGYATIKETVARHCPPAPASAKPAAKVAAQPAVVKKAPAKAAAKPAAKVAAKPATKTTAKPVAKKAPVKKVAAKPATGAKPAAKKPAAKSARTA